MSRVKIQVQSLNRVAGYIPNQMKNTFPLYPRENKYVITHFWEAHTIDPQLPSSVHSLFRTQWEVLQLNGRTCSKGYGPSVTHGSVKIILLIHILQ